MARNARKATIICHICGEAGHKSYHCPKNENAEPQHYLSYRNQNHEQSNEENRSGGNSGIPHNRPGTYQGDISNTDRRSGGGNFHHGGGHGHPVGGHGHPVGGHGHPVGGHGQPGGQPPYQPYIFHPRPQFRPHHRVGDRDRDRGDRDDNQPRRALEDVVCYKVSSFENSGLRSLIYKTYI